jgi:hypothetical protein
MSPTTDDAVVQMIRDRFDNVDRDNQALLVSFKEHVIKDEAYWKQIDDQAAQIRLAKGLAGGSVASGIALWLWEKFFR